MNIFQNKRRMNAMLTKWTCKLAKAKGASAKDGAKIRIVELQFALPLTNELRDVFPPKLAAVLKLDGNGEEAADKNCIFNSTDIKTSPTPCRFSIFKFGNYAEKGRPLVEIGGEDGAGCYADITKIFVANAETKIECIVRCQKTEPLWAWLGENFGESETTIELQQLQGDLPLATEETEQGGSETEMVDPATGEVTQQPAMASTGNTEIGAGKRAKRKSQ